MNVPLEPGTDDEIYGFVLEKVVFPLIKAFAPDFMVAELGADTLISDPLTHLKLTNNGYQKAVRGIMPLCPKILALGGRRIRPLPHLPLLDPGLVHPQPCGTGGRVCRSRGGNDVRT